MSIKFTDINMKVVRLYIIHLYNIQSFKQCNKHNQATRTILLINDVIISSYNDIPMTMAELDKHTLPA